MDIDSPLILASIAGFGMAPYWAKWSNAAFMKMQLPTLARLSGVVFLSVLAMAVFAIGPWILIAIAHGSSNFSDPNVRPALLLTIAACLGFQAVIAVAAVLISGKSANASKDFNGPTTF